MTSDHDNTYDEEYDDEITEETDLQVPQFILDRERRFRPSGRTTYIEEFTDDRGRKQRRIRIDRKGGFSDRKKVLFLSLYARTNRMGDSAAAAGVTLSTVRSHMQTDPDFGEAVVASEQEYRDHVVALIQDLAFNGTEKINYDRNGNVISTEKIYPYKLIELEAKRVEPGYRDRQDLNIGFTGGVLVAPASLGSIDEWEKRFGQKAIDAEFTEVVEALPQPEKDKIEEK